MDQSVEWLKMFITHYSSFTYAIIFIGSAFGGEPAVIALSFLAAQGMFPLFPYVLASLLGVFFSDSLYFYLGKTGTARKIIEHRYAAGAVSAIVEAINRLSRGKHLYALILAKFAIGTRAVLIMYVSKTGLRFRQFLKDNIPAILIWFFVVGAVGYGSGLGFTYFSRVLKNVYGGLGFILLVFLTLSLAQAWIKRAFIKEEEKVLEEQDQNMI